MRKLVLLALIAAVAAPAFRDELVLYLPMLASIPLDGLTTEEGYRWGMIAASVVAIIAILFKGDKESVEREPSRQIDPVALLRALLEDCKATLRYDLSDIDPDDSIGGDPEGLLNETSGKFRVIETHIDKGEYEQALARLLDAEYALWPWANQLDDNTDDNLVEFKRQLQSLVKNTQPVSEGTASTRPIAA